MTREEAIKIIDCYDIGFYDLSGEKIPADKLADAFDMAIEALQTLEAVERIKTEVLPQTDLVRCKDCKWREHIGCALSIADDSDKPKDNDFCSFGERREP